MDILPTLGVYSLVWALIGLIPMMLMIAHMSPKGRGYSERARWLVLIVATGPFGVFIMIIVNLIAIPVSWSAKYVDDFLKRI